LSALAAHPDPACFAPRRRFAPPTIRTGGTIFQHDSAECSFVDHRAAPPGRAVEERDAFERLIRPLRQRQRLLMRLLFIGGLSQREAARALGHGDPNVSFMRAGAMELLRQEYAGIAAQECRA
jgi:DNA-directed RNA polymerase specialized sigma24 family protein